MRTSIPSLLSPRTRRSRRSGAVAAVALLFVLGATAAACSDDDSRADPDAGLDAGPGPDAGDAGHADPDGGDGGGTNADAGDAGDAGSGPDCHEVTGPGATGTDTWTHGGDTATVSVSGPACGRTFTLSTTAALRDNLPANPRTFGEQPGWPSVSTGHQMFDALYALALEEVRENSVSAIGDGAYNGGSPIQCPTGGCFETGRLWSFVWTRDTAYAVDLALAALDPTRARNSLEFKVSDLRTGGSPQIVQDTGTGGSYPVSSDRAVWALGAERLIHFLDGAARAAFLATAWDAARDTIEHDRAVVFDPLLGLYRGEQSFLDWREQSYPAWTAEDPAQIAMSQALSTNVGHLRLLELGAWLAGQRGDPARQTQFQTWADDLRAAIHANLFHADLGLWATFTPGTLDRAPVRHFDLLGSALAIGAGVGSAAQRGDVVRSYPHLPPGPPVIWPQQKETPIYHNRGIWPFVTAYWLRAAARVRNDAAVGHNVRSLLRGAALNLSNMENFECVTGAPWLDDGADSGPVVNSQRQLWSVAGYLSMVHDVIFGLDTSPDGIRFAPYLTRDLRHTLFSGADRIVLNHFPYRGHRLTVIVSLPPVTTDDDGAYAVGEIRLDGQVVSNDYLLPGDLQSDSLLEITLVDTPEAADTITAVSAAQAATYQNLFAPLSPSISGVAATGSGLEVSFAGGGEPAAEIAFNVYRDGVAVATDLPGSTTSWVDTTADANAPSHCYTVEAYFSMSGNHSQHARPWCWWGPSAGRITEVSAQDFTAVGGSLVLNHGRWHYESWGDPGDTLTASGVTASATGSHLIQVDYGNGAGDISTGITCAVKRVEVIDQATSAVVGSGLLVMPHLGSWDRWAGSTFVRVDLQAGHSYDVVLSHDDQSLNMSDLEHNALYGGTGGAAGAFHHVNISTLKVLSLVAP
jgi:hypothetical protein